MKRKLLAMLLAAAMVFVMLPTTVAAAGSKTYKIGTGKDFETLEAAVADAKGKGYTEITYELYNDIVLTATNVKYEPNLAQGASTVNLVKGEGVESVKLTLAGVYFGKIGAAGAFFNAEGITFADARKRSGEGTDPDPWEFAYLEVDCKSAAFTDCSFVEGICVGYDVVFDNCHFTVEPQYYTDDSTDYSTDHYALWVSNYGDVVVRNCTFEDVNYGAIKSVWNMYGTNADLTITVENTTFDNAGKGGGKSILNLDGAAEVTVKNVTVTDCAEKNATTLVSNDIANVPTTIENVYITTGHTHDFELTFDDNYHWNSCTDENCSIIEGKAAHEGEYCECGVNGTGEKSAPNFFLFMFMKRLLTEYEITVETEGNGIVESDDDDNFIRFSHDVTFTAVPDEGSELTSILLDGEEVELPADDEYTIERVRKAHTITFVFSEIEQEPAE